MTDKKEVISSIWEKVDELEALRSQEPPSNRGKTVSAPNKAFTTGACGLIFLAIIILLMGETAYWITLCLAPVAYLIDQYSWIERIRNREAEFFNL